MTRKPDVLVIPFPAQGHVSSLMKLSLQIAAHGVKVTFVNFESIHEKVMASIRAKHDDLKDSLISFASIPDGLESEDDRTIL